MDNTGNDTPDDIKNNIREDIKEHMHRGGKGRIWVPVMLVLVGTGLLLHNLDLGIPDWIFSWQIILIAVGIFSGISHKFRGPGWLIMILVGTFFLMDKLIPGIDLHRYIWPAIIIMVGLVMLLRPHKPHWMDPTCQNRWRERDIRRWQRRRGRRGYPGMQGMPGEPFESNPGSTSGSSSGMGYSSKGFSSEDYIDATTIFGGVHKNILSKDFKGGDLTIFMGGAELNLSQADIQGTAIFDITQIMGGTKIIVPPNWDIRSQVTSIFGNVEDKRQNIGHPDPNKVLIIDGTSFFGGIEIRNY